MQFKHFNYSDIIKELEGRSSEGTSTVNIKIEINLSKVKLLSRRIVQSKEICNENLQTPAEYSATRTLPVMRTKLAHQSN